MHAFVVHWCNSTPIHNQKKIYLCGCEIKTKTYPDFTGQDVAISMPDVRRALSQYKCVQYTVTTDANSRNDKQNTLLNCCNRPQILD